MVEMRIKDLIIDESDGACEKELMLKVVEIEDNLIGGWEHSKRTNKLKKSIVKVLNKHDVI